MFKTDALKIKLHTIHLRLIIAALCNVMTRQHILVVTRYLFQFHVHCNKCPHVSVKCASQETDQAYVMVALGVCW